MSIEASNLQYPNRMYTIFFFKSLFWAQNRITEIWSGNSNLRFCGGILFLLLNSRLSATTVMSKNLLQRICYKARK